MQEAEEKKAKIEAELASTAPSPLRLHPALADRYRERVAHLSQALSNPNARSQATEAIQSLIDKIVVTRTASGTEIELVGDIAAMVNLAQSPNPENKKAALLRAALNATEKGSVKVVAGACNQFDLPFPAYGLGLQNPPILRL